MNTTPTLSALRDRIYELDVAYAKEGLPMNEYRDIAADIAEIAPAIIREQDRLLKEARAELESLCQEFEKALIPIGLGNHKVDAARAFLRQLEESV